MYKIVFFCGHICFIFLFTIGTFWRWEIIIIQSLIAISWFINNNQCILTQIEDYLFNETLIEYCFKKRSYNRFTVPKYHRYMLYTSIILGSVFHKLI